MPLPERSFELMHVGFHNLKLSVALQEKAKWTETLAAIKTSLRTKSRMCKVSGLPFKVDKAYSKRYTYTILNEAATINLNSSPTLTDSDGYVTFGTEACLRKTPFELETDLRIFLEKIGLTMLGAKVSVVDLCWDIATDTPLTQAELDSCVVTRGGSGAVFNAKRDASQLESYYVGTTRSSLLACIYNKTAQIRNTGKGHHWFEVWGGANVDLVYRIEFRLKRKFLHRAGIQSALDLVNGESALRRYLCERWLSLRVPGARSNRRPLTPLWAAIVESIPDCGPITLGKAKSSPLAAKAYTRSQIKMLARFALKVNAESLEEALEMFANLVTEVISPEKFQAFLLEAQHTQ